MGNADRIHPWATCAEFLSTHPERPVTMAQRCCEAVLDDLSSVATEPGTGPVLSDRPSPAFWIFERAPRGWPVPVLLLVWPVGAVAGVRCGRSPDAPRPSRGVPRLATTAFAASRSGAL